MGSLISSVIKKNHSWQSLRPYCNKSLKLFTLVLFKYQYFTSQFTFMCDLLWPPINYNAKCISSLPITLVTLFLNEPSSCSLIHLKGFVFPTGSANYYGNDVVGMGVSSTSIINIHSYSNTRHINTVVVCNTTRHPLAAPYDWGCLPLLLTYILFRTKFHESMSSRHICGTVPSFKRLIN